MGEPCRGHLYKQRDGSLSFTAFVSFSTRHGRHFLRVEFDPAFLQYGYFNPMWDGSESPPSVAISDKGHIRNTLREAILATKPSPSPLGVLLD